YQPQIEAESGKIVGMETLVRWRHPKKGLISAGEFIPLAEETGLISALGEWILRHACMQLREWLDKNYPPLVLSVNISGRQLDDKRFLENIRSILHETNVPPNYLELEITESAVMRKPEEVIPALETLRKQGINLAIDDFGTGHSSLNYLRRFPVNTLKIDRSFVNDISKSPQDSIIINGIIALAKSLHLKVIAEGVETYEQKMYLKEQKCDWLQGYYLYKPMSADMFEQQAFFNAKVTNF
ncbi:MAG TPA: EAL domain-containing protein, partial [Gammaproteobacteria bacterium]